MIDEVRGSIRVRAWPKPRGKNRNATNVFWTNWLKGVTYLYRYQPGPVQFQLQEATKGTVWMPRDVFISAARGRAFLLQDENGRTWYPRAMVQDVSNSLDSIGQTPGDMLWRGPDLWVPVPGGSAGQYLTYVDDSNPPEWTSSAASKYLTYPVHLQNQGLVTFGVNSTSYVSINTTLSYFDFSAFLPTEYRFTFFGRSNQAGQTVTIQLARQSQPTIPYSASGDDLVVTNTATDWDTGWIAIPNAPNVLRKIVMAGKGSNSTVDIEITEAQMHFRTV